MFEGIQHLTAAMAAGDAGAIDAFYRRYFGWMYAHARRVTKRDESFCLDVVQDAVLRVIRTVKPVDCESRFLGWLRLVVQTTAFDLLRREARRKNREAMTGASQLSVSSDSLQLDWLREQIIQLDPELVNIIELRFEQSWTLRRIGEKLGLSIGAVDGRLRRALKNLKLAADEPAAVIEAVPEPELVTVDTPAVVEATEASVEQVEVVRDDPAKVIEPTQAAVETPAVHEAAEVNVEAGELIAADAAIEKESASSVDVSTVAVETSLEPAAVEATVESSLVLEPMLASTDSPVATVEPVEVSATEEVSAELELVSAYREAASHKMPVLFEAVSTAVQIETPELAGLEDEAGAYDDRI